MTGKIRRNRENFYIDLLYIDLHWKGERILPFSDRDGNPLYSERQAQRPLERIRSEIDSNDLDPKNYVKRELKALACRIMWTPGLNARWPGGGRRNLSGISSDDSIPG